MIDDTIARIEARLRTSEPMLDSTRAELMQLLASLREEIRQLPAAAAPQAERIVRAAETSAEAATAYAEGGVPYPAKPTSDLVESVREFEGSHPQLVQVVNNLANTLAGLGI
jgi:hypothetical protein